MPSYDKYDVTVKHVAYVICQEGLYAVVVNKCRQLRLVVYVYVCQSCCLFTIFLFTLKLKIKVSSVVYCGFIKNGINMGGSLKKDEKIKKQVLAICTTGNNYSRLCNILCKLVYLGPRFINL